MKNNILILAILFVGILIGNTISEITYKKRKVAEVKRDFPQIFKKSLFAFGVLVFFTYLYYVLGISFKD